MLKSLKELYTRLKIIRIKYESDMKIANVLFDKTFVSGGIVAESKEGFNIRSDDRMMKPNSSFSDQIYFDRLNENINKIFGNQPYIQTKYGKDYLKG